MIGQRSERDAGLRGHRAVGDTTDALLADELQRGAQDPLARVAAGAHGGRAGPDRRAALAPSADRLELRAERQQRRLAVGRAEQLGADRQAVGGQAGGDVDPGPADDVPGKAKGQVAPAVVLVAQ